MDRQEIMIEAYAQRLAQREHEVVQLLADKHQLEAQLKVLIDQTSDSTESVE